MALRQGKDFLAFHDLPEDAVLSIIDRAGSLAHDWSKRTMPQLLKGKRIGLIVDDTGWRNTAAFDLGIQAMGGICASVPISFNGREEIADLAGYLDNWFDLVIIRTKELATLRALAAEMRAPVINARTKSNHPCETLGDLAYIKSVRGPGRRSQNRRRRTGCKYLKLVGRGLDFPANSGHTSLPRTMARHRCCAHQPEFPGQF